ncbi:MAG: hypothetical protein K9J27_01305 [Bacteroidales bacterium]|nr:hypothetical protein [Bacteroidales bacterium]MCF8332610.1 hypothetical protein [Bacteroidales bacterium]
MRTLKYTLALSLSMFFLGSGYAQQENQEENGYNEQVTIIAPFQPSISDARKMEMTPSVEPEVPEKREVSYNIRPQKIEVSFEPEKMEPVRVKSESRKPLKANFVKAGFGNYSTPYAELFSTTGPSEKHRAGFHVKHLSHSGDIEDYATPNNSHNLAEIFGEKYFDNSSLYGKLRYNREVYHRYGFQPNAPAFQNMDFTDDGIRQQYSSAGANIRFENIDKDKEEFDYHLALDYYSWWDDYNSLEHSLALDVHGNKPVDWFDAINYQSFGINGNFEFFNSGDSIEAINTVHISFRPFMEIKSGFYYLKGGVNLSSIMTDDKDAQMTIFPDIHTRIHMVPGYLTLFGGLTGEKDYHSLRSLTEENPFVESGILLNDNRQHYSNTKMNAFGGLKGNITRGVDFRLKVAYREKDAYPLYVTNFDKVFENEFEIRYDDLTITDFSAGFTIKGGEQFKLDVDGHYYNYSTTNEEKPWHLPELRIHATTEYEFNAPLPLTLSLSSTALTGRYVEDDQGAAIPMEDIIDLSAELKYDYNKSLTAFLRINNLTSQRQYNWYNYPSYRLNFLIGAGYSF